MWMALTNLKVANVWLCFQVELRMMRTLLVSCTCTSITHYILYIELHRHSLINYEVQSTSTGVCITCTFLESSTTNCVAVVHQRISQLNSSGLMNIESSHKFTRSGDTASGCIEGVNLEDYQVGVLGGVDEPLGIYNALCDSLT